MGGQRRGSTSARGGGAALRRALAAPLAVLAAAALLAGCGAPHGLTPNPFSTAPVAAGVPAGMPRPGHVLVVVFENKAADQVIGDSAAPYLTALAAQGADFTNAHGVAHPSQPNYLALFSGSTQGVTSDTCPERFGGRANLAAQLHAAGLSFVGYAEGLPRPGWPGCQSGGYVRKHAPWADFPGLPSATAQPLSALPSDLSRLPTVAFVVPDLCNDMHDCSVATGDRWAQAHLAGFVSWARTHDSLLLVTFDEDDGSRTNHIATFMVGPMVRPGHNGDYVDHYSVLRTIEDLYRLPALGQARRAHPLMQWR